MDTSRIRDWAPTIIAVAIAEGNQLSGLQIPWLSSVLFGIAGLLILDKFGVWMWPNKWPSLQISFPITDHTEESVGLREVMYWVDEKSAWGRWQKSQMRMLNPGGHEQMQKIHWVSEIQRQAESGKLLVDARRKNSLDREPIKRDFWDTAYLHVIPHDRSIWRIIVVPKDGLEEEAAKQITDRDYSDLRTTWSQAKLLWPEKDKLCDKLTRENLKKKSTVA